MTAMRLAGAFALLLMGSELLVGCGGVPAVATVSGASLNGNWNLVGDGSPLSFPSLSFSLVVEGNQVYANGFFLVGCSNPQGAFYGGGGGSLELTGQLAADGTFTLTQPAPTSNTLDGDLLTISVTGRAAEGGAAGWTGSYSMTTPAGSTGCLVNETGNFTAVAFAPLTGTYAGALSAANTGAGGVSASLNLMQGAATSQVLNHNTLYYLPLTGTMAVTGIPCFTHGSTDTPGVSQIAGVTLTMNFAMDDGSQMILLGQLVGTNETSLSIRGVLIHGGQCDGSYYGTLSQP